VGASHSGSTLQPSFRSEWLTGNGGIAALFGFQNEAATLIQIDEICGGRAVKLFEYHGFVDHIRVRVFIGCAGVRPDDSNEVTQLRQEERIVGAFRGRGSFPARDEVVGSARQRAYVLTTI
jgi:hypothetical protein